MAHIYRATDSAASSAATEADLGLTYEELCAIAEELPSHAFHGEHSPEVETVRQKTAVVAFLTFRSQSTALLAALDGLLGEEESTDVEDVLTKYMRDRLDTRASVIFVFTQFYTAPAEGREAIVAGALAKLEQPKTLYRVLQTLEWFINNPPAQNADEVFGD